jgi:hypothetical protein
MKGMLITEFAVLLHFHSASVRSAVLGGTVITLSTFLAGECDYYPHFMSCLFCNLVY